MPAGVDGNEQDLLPAFGLLTTPRCYSAVVVSRGAVSSTHRVVVVVGDGCVFARSSHCGVVLFAAFPVSASGALARAALVLVPATGAAEAPWLG